MAVHTLLLRLSGPMQSWGTQSRFSVRDTGLEPSKSGVIGLLCAALGRGRERSVDDLAALRFGVRVNREGIMAKDFHTAVNVLKADGKKPSPQKDIKDKEEQKKFIHPKFTVVSTRYYLSDADFLVGFEGQDLALLEQLEAAVKNPVWCLFLGRKAFPPGKPVWVPDGLKKETRLEQALKEFLWNPGFLKGKPYPKPLRLMLETPYGEGEVVRTDHPLSFRKGDRRFHLRYSTIEYHPPVLANKEEDRCISPD